jgi:hypothetical protein
MRAQLPWSQQIDLVLKNALFWHLAFWEWIGSAAVFLFLLSSALFLPEQTSGLRGRRQTEKTLDVDCRQIVDRKSAI